MGPIGFAETSLAIYQLRVTSDKERIYHLYRGRDVKSYTTVYFAVRNFCSDYMYIGLVKRRGQRGRFSDALAMRSSMQQAELGCNVSYLTEVSGHWFQSLGGGGSTGRI